MQRFGVVVMGTIRDLNDIVDIAKEIMKKDKNISWLAAIDEARKIVLRNKNKDMEIEWTKTYYNGVGEVVAVEVVKTNENKISNKE